jgi:4-hydroxythreonine-4-phosphate dehydrogenase
MSDHSNRRVRLAVTLGDPRGVGPEVARAAADKLQDDRDHGDTNTPALIFVGPSGLPGFPEVDSVGEWRSTRDGGDGATDAAARIADAGSIAGRAIEHAARLALNGQVDGIVTAPIDKAALHAGNYDFPGHTEMLASIANDAEVVMMMAAETTALGGPLRVVLATTHVALADVPSRFSADVLVTQAGLTASALRNEWNIRNPRVALCAFNPHASDGGLFGNQEEVIYGPAMDRLRGMNIDVYGPVPADTVFVRAARGEFDVVIAPYHDVGMAAFKTAAFGHGVNVTLGLPFVRTSPDHGTAIDIAGRGIADPSSMIEAIRLADQLVRRRNGMHVA